MKSGFLRVHVAIVGIGVLGWLPHTAFAQYGGYGGGEGNARWRWADSLRNRHRRSAQQ
jgi:hypothetical protein